MPWEFSLQPRIPGEVVPIYSRRGKTQREEVVFFRGTQLVTGQSQGSNPHWRPCWYNHCSALPSRDWHAKALAPTGCREYPKWGGGVRSTFWSSQQGQGLKAGPWRIPPGHGEVGLENDLA